MSKMKALLLDLDDTLLLNDMETFAAHYFKALLAKTRKVCPAELFMASLEAAMRAMFYNDGTDGTNAEVFAREFFPRIGRSPEELMPLFEEFYAQDFEALRQHTTVLPEARVLVELAFAKGYQVAIATQPMFPLVAIKARLRWAGVGAEEFPYDFIASYETMRACKPHPHYFASILERLGRLPGECLMVGDSPDSDMAAGKLGIKTFWVRRERESESTAVSCDAQGSLRELIALIQTGGVDEL